MGSAGATEHLTPELAERLSAYIDQRMGLHFPPERVSDLERGLHDAGEALGCTSLRASAEKLLSMDVTRTEIESLAAHLTIGETYFFRNPEVFEALESTVFPELIERRRHGERHLRIWSAACSSGEEPYSIAMTLARAFPEASTWANSILGTDINPTALAKARQHEYGPWSFRGTPDSLRATCFRETRPGIFRVNADIREKVRFLYLNLAEDVYPSLLNSTNAMDVIFCRNVLIYFNNEGARRVVRRLYDCLVEGGWLVVSPSESFLLFDTPLRLVEAGGTTFFRKPFGREVGGPAPTAEPPYEPPHEPATVSEPEPAFGEAAPTVLEPAVEPVEHARSCANDGRLDEALAWCDRAIEAEPLDATAHYLHGTILQELGRAEDAIGALKKALYVEPDHVLAQFVLGNLLLQTERQAHALRCFRNVGALLAGRGDDEPLPAGDGLTVGRLREIAAEVIREEGGHERTARAR